MKIPALFHKFQAGVLQEKSPAGSFSERRFVYGKCAWERWRT